MMLLGWLTPFAVKTTEASVTVIFINGAATELTELDLVVLLLIAAAQAILE